MERQIAEVLQGSGDGGGAFLWRRICRDLAGGLRVGVAASDPRLASRVIEQLNPHVEAEWVSLTLQPGQGPSLGTADRALGVHILLWATSAQAALGAGEREALEGLAETGAPRHRALVVADLHIVHRMSDDPQAECAEVLARLKELVPRDTPVLDTEEAASWVRTAGDDLHRLVMSRRGQVSRVLLQDAQRSARDSVTAAQQQVDHLDALLDQEEAQLRELRDQGRRLSAHLVSSIQRETDRVIIDLGDFLHHLEQRLPDEVATVDDVDQLRRALPHWLQHVTETWLSDRIAQWRVDVLADLADLGMTEDELVRAELLTPGLHPGPLTGERDWTTRLGATAALGGGAALLLMGLWAPGLIAVGGGLGWSQLRSAARGARTRDALTTSAVQSLRSLTSQATDLLRDQVEQARTSLGDLGNERAAAHEVDRAAERDQLERSRNRAGERLAEVTRTAEILDEQVAGLQYLFVEGA